MYLANDFGAIGKSMDAFASAAASGGFAISETGGHALIGAIQRLGDWVDMQELRLLELQQAPMLGDSDGAKVMKPHVQNVAIDGQGFLEMLVKFRESLTKAEQGINDAMLNYKTMDETEARRLRPS